MAASGLALALLLIAASPARSAPLAAPALELPSGLTLRAGERYEIRWAVPDDGVDELEILLSIDGGRRFPLRISPELDARAGCYVWRVPNLSSADARLRIRYHRGRAEVDGETSPAFTLIASACGDGAPRGEANLSPAGAATFEAEEDGRAPVHEGTWWSGLEGLAPPLARGEFSAPEDRIIERRELPAAGPLPAAPSIHRRVALSRAVPVPLALGVLPRATREPHRYRPLRN
ncbi:MAG: hypothetical protein ACRENS_07890 [Candidatus Eiseniibacteriota bacterium]